MAKAKNKPEANQEPAAEAPEEKAENEEKAEAQKTALAKQAEHPKPPMLIGDKGIEIKNLDDLWRFAQYVAKSGFAPKGMESPESLVVAIQAGFELGISPMTAIQGSAVINGRHSFYGDLQKAIVEKSGLLEDFHEEEFGKPFTDEWTFRCMSKRRGKKRPVIREFSWAEAKEAGLTSKDIYKKWPKRMMMFKPRSWSLRDNFGDVLKGFLCAEEAMDIPKDAEVLSVETAPAVSVKDIVDAQPGEPVDASFEVTPENVDQETGEILDIENELKPSPEQVAEAKRQAEALKKKVESEKSAPVEPPPPDDPGPDDSEEEAKKATELVELAYSDWTQKGGDIKSLTFLCKARFNDAAPDQLDADEAARLYELVETYPGEEVLRFTDKQNRKKTQDRYERKKQ